MTTAETYGTAGHRFTRVTDVVWRSGPDRVLIQRIGGPPDVAAIDLLGDVAFTWIALDTPATLSELGARLADAGIDVADLDADVAYLVDHQLVDHQLVDHRPSTNDAGPT